MDLLAGLTQGFALLLSPAVLAACAIGLVAGIAGGLLPGFSPLGAMALAIAFLTAVAQEFGPASPIAFMVAFAYGTLYGRALAAMGDGAASAAAAPRARPALRPLLGGVALAVAIAAAAGAIAVYARLNITLSFGPAELAAAIVFLLLAGAAFGTGSTASALAMVLLGLLVACVGAEIASGVPRLTFGLAQLADGIDPLDVALGLFVIANVFADLGRAAADRIPPVAPDRGATPGLLRGAILAVLAAFLPTNGAGAASTPAERQARPIADPFDPASRTDMPGVLGATLASDMRFSLSLVPLLAWFVPCDAVAALLWRVFTTEDSLLHQTGRAQTGTIWLVCATLIVVHIAPLAIFRVPQRAVAWLRRLDIRIVAPLIVAVCGVAIMSVTRNPVDLALMFGFGLVGYGMILADLDRSLVFFAFVLGSHLEENIGRTLLIARGDVTTFVTRRTSAGFLAAGVVLLVAVRVWRFVRRRGRVGAPATA